MNILRKNINQAYTKHSAGKPFIVAIDGLSGSGKTTMVEQLRDLSKDVVVFHIDDFIVERSKRYGTGESEAMEYYALQWDVDLLVKTLFKPLQEGKTKLTLPYYERDRDEVINRTVEIAPNALVLIEGIFLLRDEWRRYFDYIVYLDCPREVRYERALHRDTYIGDLAERLDKYTRRYWPGEAHYVKTINPKAKADHIVHAD
ncbi:MULTISPECIES: kinase [Exiguobacterium]|uniref:kinase n=1 Tax=Exiguobacterium TaxID=33986 RepID=UPI0021AF900B|nr:kinase [Exiguobacterium himgiriensis]MCT4782972.1 kinase [Exiguobacterium himgiriensis]